MNKVLLLNNIRTEKGNDNLTSSNLADFFNHSNLNTEPNNVKSCLMNNDNKNDLKKSENVKNSSKLNGLQKNLSIPSLLNSLLSITPEISKNSFSHKQSIQKSNLRYDM